MKMRKQTGGRASDLDRASTSTSTSQIISLYSTELMSP